MHETFGDDEWTSELKKILNLTVVENKPVILSLDQFTLVKEEWYEDLICIMKNDFHTGMVDTCEQDKLLLEL